MDRSLAYILLCALALIGVLCLLGVLRDLRSGKSRLAHETHDSRRDELPLNFWLGVAGKGAGAALGLVLAIAVLTRLD